MATPIFRFDPVELPPEAVALRQEVRSFIKEHQHLMGFTRGEFNRDFSRAMGKRGWIGMTWPKQYGGHERSSFERYVVIEEMLVAGAPLSAHYTGDRQSGPNLLRFGTEEQKQFFLPKIAAGELTFCIGMSEPDSGSDLAGTRTRAVKVDGGYKINGSKLWTSNAHRADYAILFCKMAQEGQADPDRHAGATQFLLPLKSPGIDIRPVRNLLGEHHFNEIFLTDVFVPDWLLLGKEGNGWNQVTSELSFERSAPDRFLVFFQVLREMLRMAGPHPDRATAAALGRLVAQLATLRSMSLSIAGMLQEGMQPNSESAVVKDLGTRYEQDIPVVARHLFPTEPELEAVDVYTSMIARATMNAPRLSIQGGTREILRGIIARGLGLR
jgi:alkylation response protein AidB-like acyl-CoA dehydrogenase